MFDQENAAVDSRILKLSLNKYLKFWCKIPHYYSRLKAIKKQNKKIKAYNAVLLQSKSVLKFKKLKLYNCYLNAIIKDKLYTISLRVTPRNAFGTFAKKTLSTNINNVLFACAAKTYDLQFTKKTLKTVTKLFIANFFIIIDRNN